MACEYVRNDQVPEAVRIISALIFLSPKDARYYQLVGICLQRLKHHDIAEPYYRIAIMLDPADARTQVYLGESLMMQKKAQLAVACLNRGLELAEEKDDLQDVRDRAQILLKQAQAG